MMNAPTIDTKRSMVKVWHVALAFVAAFLFAVTTVQPAQATTTTLHGEQGLNIYREWNVLRHNTYPQNAVSFTKTHDSKGSGAGLTLGLRRTSGSQSASGTSYGSATSIRTTAGSAAIPGGSFYINSRLINGSCGTGCGIVYWEARFNYNIRWN